MKLNALIACALVLLAACSTSQHSRAKMNPLIGTWVGMSATVDGRVLPEATVHQLRLSLTENQYRTEKGNEVLFDSTYTTDPSKEPKHINMIGTEGELAGKTAEGIYSLKADTLEVCYTMPGKPRPGSFSSPAGSGIFLVVWKRQRP